jgi:hypothetical protein
MIRPDGVTPAPRRGLVARRCGMCQQRYCVGCGEFRVLIAQILICTECYADWLRATPPRLRDRALAAGEHCA